MRKTEFLPFAAHFAAGGFSGSPWCASVDLGSLGHGAGLRVPPSGSLQLLVCNPQGAPVFWYVVKYDISSMPKRTKTLLRQTRFKTRLGKARQCASTQRRPVAGLQMSLATPVSAHHYLSTLRFFFPYHKGATDPGTPGTRIPGGSLSTTRGALRSNAASTSTPSLKEVLKEPEDEIVYAPAFGWVPLSKADRKRFRSALHAIRAEKEAELLRRHAARAAKTKTPPKMIATAGKTAISKAENTAQFKAEGAKLSTSPDSVISVGAWGLNRR